MGTIAEDTGEQLRNMASMPFIHRHVAAMPGAHCGTGSAVGAVVATDRAIIPAAVGLDIGCGALAMRTNLHSDQLLSRELQEAITVRVPRGNDEGLAASGNWPGLQHQHTQRLAQYVAGLTLITDKHPALEDESYQIRYQAGTLGNGHGFVKVCVDEDKRVWIVVHAGSRQIGTAIARHFLAEAKQAMRRWFIDLADQDLAYLPSDTELAADYIEAASWACEFAQLNRELLGAAALQALKDATGAPVKVVQKVESTHNFVVRERHFGKDVQLSRKGAISARFGVLGVVAGSAVTPSYIVTGRGNAEAFNSASAGLVEGDGASASAALAEIMAAQEDLVSVIHTLRPVLAVGQ